MSHLKPRRFAHACPHTTQRFYAKGLCRQCYFRSLKRTQKNKFSENTRTNNKETQQFSSHPNLPELSNNRE